MRKYITGPNYQECTKTLNSGKIVRIICPNALEGFKKACQNKERRDVVDTVKRLKDTCQTNTITAIIGSDR